MKAWWRSAATQGWIYRGNKKTSKGVFGPLRGFTWSLFGNPIFSFYSPKAEVVRLMGLLNKLEIGWLTDALIWIKSQEDNSLCYHHWLPSERVDLWKNYLTLDNRKHCLWDLIADFLHRICSGVTAGFTNVIRSIDQSRIIDSKTEPTSACSWLVVQFLKGLICRP